jgi:hypothetical protein
MLASGFVALDGVLWAVKNKVATATTDVKIQRAFISNS